MTPSEKRFMLAQKAYDEAKDKLAIEKTIYVNEKTFQECLGDKNDHHRKSIEGKGFIRIYHKPFWTDNPGGMGRTYHHGIINVVNKDSPINKSYSLWESDGNLESELCHRIKILGHRIVSIGSTCGETCVVLIPQRINFDN